MTGYSIRSNGSKKKNVSGQGQFRSEITVRFGAFGYTRDVVQICLRLLWSFPSADG